MQQYSSDDWVSVAAAWAVGLSLTGLPLLMYHMYKKK